LRRIAAGGVYDTGGALVIPDEVQSSSLELDAAVILRPPRNSRTFAIVPAAEGLLPRERIRYSRERWTLAFFGGSFVALRASSG
jgi:hypothetical protein